MKQKYYNIENLLSKKADYNLLLGERSNGKSYSVKDTVLWEAYNELDYYEFLKGNKVEKKRYQFAYLRRWREEIRARDVELYFDDMDIANITNGEFESVKCYRNDIFLVHKEDDKEVASKKVGACFCLTGVQHYKSLAFPKIGNVIFEEFITNQGYLGHEATSLSDIISTIARRDYVRVFMIGNTINRLCPYFTEWELSHVKDQKQGTIDIYSHHTDQVTEQGEQVVVTIAVEFCANSGNNSKMFFGQRSKMITSGEWESANYPHLPRPSNTYKVKYSIYYKYSQYAYLIDLIGDNGERFLYVHQAPNEVPIGVKRVVTDGFTTDKHTTFYLTALTRYDTIIIDLINQHKIYFADNLTGTEFWQIKKERGCF